MPLPELAATALRAIAVYAVLLLVLRVLGRQRVDLEAGGQASLRPHPHAQHLRRRDLAAWTAQHGNSA